jgi:uncharacterized membrane protein
MKNIKEILLGIFGLFLFTYIPFGFVIGEWNPIQWNVFIRALYIVAIATILTYAINEQKKK